jgi:hypothetical protein
MARWKWILLVISGLLLVAAVVQLRRKPEEPYIAEVALSDGTSGFRLLKMTEGPLDYDWKDPTPEFMRMLPPPIGSRHVPFVPVHLDGYTMFDRFPGISFYFRPVDARGRYTDGPRGIFNPSIEFQESTGFVFHGRSSFGTPEHSAFGVAGLTVSALPRRDPMLKILVYENRPRSGAPHVMEVKNPFYRPEFPVWQGRPLPLEAEIKHPSAPEGAKVVLKKLTFFDYGHLSMDHLTDSKSKSWHPAWHIWLEDATGNRGMRLSPFEPAWKVHVEFDPSAEVDYPDDVVWRIGRWKRPADLSMTELTPPQHLAGLNIESAFLAGAGCLQTVDGKSSMVPLSKDFTGGFRTSGTSGVVNGKAVSTHRLESGQPFLIVNSPPIDRESAILVRLRSGTTTIGCSSGTSITSTAQRTNVHLDRWPDDGEEWDLELIYAKKPKVEFLVTPPDDAREALMKSPGF